jgi:hypothetical protein
MNKQEALDKIEELKKFVEDCDKPTKTWEDAVKEVFGTGYNYEKSSSWYDGLTITNPNTDRYCFSCGGDTERLCRFLAKNKGYFWIGYKDNKVYMTVVVRDRISYVKAREELAE